MLCVCVRVLFTQIFLYVQQNTATTRSHSFIVEARGAFQMISSGRWPLSARGSWEGTGYLFPLGIFVANECSLIQQQSIKWATFLCVAGCDDLIAFCLQRPANNNRCICILCGRWEKETASGVARHVHLFWIIEGGHKDDGISLSLLMRGDDVLNYQRETDVNPPRMPFFFCAHLHVWQLYRLSWAATLRDLIRMMFLNRSLWRVIACSCLWKLAGPHARVYTSTYVCVCACDWQVSIENSD